MSPRIPVLLSQAGISSAAARHLEEQLIEQLLFEVGVDASIIPDLEQLHQDSTGWLCLEGIAGDFILLHWVELAKAQTILTERGIQGCQGKTRLDDLPESSAGDSPTARERKIYFLPLRADLPVADYLNEIRRIRDEASVQTYDVQDLLKPFPASPPGTRSEPPNTDRGETVDSQPSTPGAQETTKPPPQTDEAAGEDELDRLLDELDELDL